MSDPSLVECTQDTWIKVATNVTVATIHTAKLGRYFVTQRSVGSAAPTDDTDAREATNWELWVRNSTPIDVYLKAVGHTGNALVMS